MRQPQGGQPAQFRPMPRVSQNQRRLEAAQANMTEGNVAEVKKHLFVNESRAAENRPAPPPVVVPIVMEKRFKPLENATGREVRTQRSLGLEAMKVMVPFYEVSTIGHSLTEFWVGSEDAAAVRETLRASGALWEGSITKGPRGSPNAESTGMMLKAIERRGRIATYTNCPQLRKSAMEDGFSEAEAALVRNEVMAARGISAEELQKSCVPYEARTLLPPQAPAISEAQRQANNDAEARRIAAARPQQSYVLQPSKRQADARAKFGPAPPKQSPQQIADDRIIKEAGAKREEVPAELFTAAGPGLFHLNLAAFEKWACARPSSSSLPSSSAAPSDMQE